MNTFSIIILLMGLILILISLLIFIRTIGIKNDIRQFGANNKEYIKDFGGIISQNQKQITDMQDKRLGELNEKFNQMTLESEQKLENMRQSLSLNLQKMTEDNNQQLEKMRETVDEKLQKTLENRLTESFKMVSERLEEVHKGLGEMQNLASGVGDLKKVLSNVKSRGVLGEYQLGAILDEVLSPEQYERNVHTKKNSRANVEFAVKLPADDDRSIYLPIDSKFPGDRYRTLMDAYEAGDISLIEEAKKNLTIAIKQEAKDIKEKYISPPDTTDFGIMFLPFEGLYAEVVRMGLVEVLQREYKVNIAGPTTMAALLNSLQMGFRTLAIEKRSSEVWEILSAIKVEFGKFEKTISTAQNRLNLASKDLDELVGTRTRAIQRTLRDVTTVNEVSAVKLLDIEDED